MGKLKKLQIVFDKGVDVFSPGDIIKGEVALQVEAEAGRGLENVKGVWVRFNGEAIIQRSGDSSQAYRMMEEGYFDTTQILFGTGTETPDVHNLNIPPGRQGLPFAIRLPAERLPAAFEGQYGYVRYRIKATVSLIRSIRYKEYKTEKYFSVIGPAVDLNSIEGLKTPITSDSVSRGWLGFGAPVATVSLSLPKQGYVPGESINVKGRVDNRGGDDHISVRVKFIQEIHFLFRNRVTSVKNVLAKIESQVVCPRGRVSNFTVGPLRVPPIPPSGLPGCNIIDIEYFILCKDRKFALTIGTVPLRTAAPGRRRAPRSTAGQRSAASESAACRQGNDDAPPSYEEAVGVTDRIAYELSREDCFSDAHFLPRYPYFERMGNLAFSFGKS